MTRAEVYRLIDGDRECQDAVAERASATGGRLAVGEHLVLLATYIDRAQTAWVDNPGDDEALEVVRKIAGIAVRCLEQHGALPRSARYSRDVRVAMPTGQSDKEEESR